MSKILVVDDEEGLLEVLQIQLRDFGDIYVAKDGKEALTILGERGSIDVVILDIRMPVMDGKVLLAEIRKMHPDTSVIMLTAWGASAGEWNNVNECRRLGIYRFIEKGDTPEADQADQLVSTVAQLLEERPETLLLNRRFQADIDCSRVSDSIISIRMCDEYLHRLRVEIENEVAPYGQIVCDMKAVTHLSERGALLLMKLHQSKHLTLTNVQSDVLDILRSYNTSTTFHIE